MRERGIHLKKYFQQEIAGLMKKHAISGEISESHEEIGILSVNFEGFDPYPLYMALNNAKIHCKCIKDADSAGNKRQIMRFGFPYYETKSRLQTALLKLDQYLGQFVAEHLEKSAPGYVPADNPAVEGILFG